jgi:multiphosphoryl transfer protein
MVGIVVVSHSRALARSAVELASQMLHGIRPDIAVAAGLDDTTLGTDAVQVKEAIEQVDGPDGVVVLLDLGSAVLSAELALDLLDDTVRDRVIVSPAPLVEGLVAAAVTAAGGGSARDVAAEAAAALAGKQAHLSPTAAVEPVRIIDEGAVRGEFVVANAHGLHARPAARLVAQVRTLDARVQLTNRTTGAGPVPASSLSRVATLGALPGHEIEVSVTGSQATEALEQILALAARHFDETDEVAPPQPPAATGPLAAAPGLAIGPARRADARTPAVPNQEPGDAVTHWRRLREAIAATRRDLSRTRARVNRESGDADAAIFDAHLMLLDDADLLADARAHIDAGTGAARGWHDAVTRIEHEFAELDDAYLRARAADVRAVGEQVLRHLLGVAPALSPEPGVLLAADLTPTDAAELDPRVTSAVVLALGSPTSHASILARAKGIPMLVAAGVQVLGTADGTPLIVDADAATLVVDPPDDVRAGYELRIAEQAAAAIAHAAAAAIAVTADGTMIAVCANVGSVDDAKAAADAHADGAGLVRTEFLFQSRSEPPSVDEQEAVYRAITDAFGGRRVVFRTLDAGADKPLPFLHAERETNPYLGVRGIRLALQHPELLRQQLHAICAVALDAPVSVMFPMVSTVDELVAALAVLDEACAGERPEGMRVGMMIEVPSAALKAAAFAPYVDFFSIGTNDLTQYALAAERGNPALASLADSLDPGVLELIDAVCRDAGAASVSVCGEAAADPVAVPLLIGLGVDSLSVAAPSVAGVKQAVRLVDKAQAASLSTQALHCATAAEVRRLVSAA